MRFASGGFNGSFLYTVGITGTRWADRTVDVIWPLAVAEGQYRIDVYIPYHAPKAFGPTPQKDATRAQYWVRGVDGQWADANVVDQETVSNGWRSIGIYPLNGQSAVRLGNNIGASNEWVIFDAVRAVPNPIAR